jgi:serine protease Do
MTSPVSRPSTQPPRPLQSRWLQRTGSSLALMLLGAGVVTVGNGALQARHPQINATPAQAILPGPSSPVRPTGNESLAAAPTSFVATIVQEVGPAVVRIDASRTVTARVPEPFRQFFGDVPEGRRQRVEQGVGSGFIVSDDGRILTNAHVVEGADTVQVTLKDGRSYEGRVVGADPVTDVAVIDIDAEDLPTVALSDSDQLQPGEWAIAIGNPLGLDNTVTVGIVSATGRSSGQVGVSDKRVDFIQTDAAINPGNSGGPLLNAQGEVIGMNTAIIQDAQGIGFAIPINSVERIADQLVTTGRVEHPYLGIRMVSLNDQTRDRLEAQSELALPEEDGVLVVEVVPGSPAARAGLQAGDVLVSVNDTPVAEAKDVQNQVEASTIGVDLAIALLRDGRNQTLTVQPATLPTR